MLIAALTLAGTLGVNVDAKAVVGGYNAVAPHYSHANEIIEGDTALHVAIRNRKKEVSGVATVPHHCRTVFSPDLPTGGTLPPGLWCPPRLEVGLTGAGEGHRGCVLRGGSG